MNHQSILQFGGAMRAMSIGLLLFAGSGCHLGDFGSEMVHPNSSSSLGPGDIVFAVGNNATILRSADGGQSWNEATNGSTALLRGVYFLDSRTGWATGGQEVLRTTDGGETWLSATPTTKTFRDVFFADFQNGWAVGSDGAIYHSDDGGVDWRPQVSGTSYTLESVHFADASTGWVVGGNGADPNEGAVLHTDDGGLSWQIQRDFGPGTYMSGVFFKDASQGWAVGGSGQMWYTDDGGVNWGSPLDLGSGAGPHEILFVNATHGWAAGAQTLLRTIDGGVSWSAVPVPAGMSYIRGVDFANTSVGLLVGDDGKIFRTTDNGDTWTSVSATSTEHLWGVDFAGPLVGDIRVSPASIDFGEVYIGVSESASVGIRNAGDVALTVTAVAVQASGDPGFTVALPSPVPFDVPPGEKQTAVATFTPSEAGAAAAALEIISNDPDQSNLLVPMIAIGRMVDSDGDGIPDDEDPCPDDAPPPNGDLEGDGCTDTPDDIVDSGAGLVEALEEIVNDPTQPDDVREAAEDAVRRLRGNRGGIANNGMLDKIADGDLVAAAVMASEVVEALQLAARAGLDTQAEQEQTVRLLLAAVVVAAEELRDTVGPDDPDVQAADAAIANAVDALADGRLLNAVAFLRKAAEHT